MREGWTYKKLGDIAEFSRGLTYSKHDEVDSSENVVLRSNNIDLLAGKLDFSELKYLKQEFQIPDEKRLKKGSLFICMSNGSKAHLGKVAYIDKDYNYAFGGFMGQISPIKDVDGKYLHYALSSPQYKLYIKDLSAGANINNLKIKDLELFEIHIAPYEEQQRIVSRLDSAFSHIDELKANAEKQLSEARALFQKSLAKAMEPKEGWEEKKLIEITHEKCPISYGIVQQGNHIDGGIPVVRPVDLREKYITRQNLKCTTQTISNSYKRTILKGDELLLSVRGTTGIISLATPELKGCNVNRGIVPLYFKDQFYKDFLYYEMVSPSLQSVFAEKTTGSTLKQINIKDLRLIKLSIPPLSEQQRIVDRLDALSAHVRELEENQKKIISECDALKQALLRKVFE